MKHSFKFDKKTGTIVTDKKTVQESLTEKHDFDVQESATGDVEIPVFQEQKSINTKNKMLDSVYESVVKMKKVDYQTPIQLIDKNGMPESYIDTETTGIMMFRELQDYDICQITDEKSGKVLAYIGGYALQINFNMSELNTMERVEQCLQGIVKLFRHKIMTQTFDKWEEPDRQ